MKLLIAAVLASVGLNVYLLATRDDRLEPEVVEPTVEPTASAAKRLLAPSPSRPGSYGSLERSDLEQRVLVAEAEVEQFMRPDERYAKQSRSPETEARVKPYLDLVFKDLDLKEPKYTVECHGMVCKLDADRRDANVWMSPLQTTYPQRAMFATMSFSDTTFIEVRPEPEAWAAMIDAQARRQIYGCATTYPAPTGELSYRVTKDRTVQLDGPLANEQVGRCIKLAVENAIAKIATPSNIVLPQVDHPLTIPLEY
jgi:hypothetical protein